jgi:hypothetical protein
MFSGTKMDPKLKDLSFIYKEKSLELIQVNWLGLGLIKILDVGKRSTVNCDALINQSCCEPMKRTSIHAAISLPSARTHALKCLDF